MSQPRAPCCHLHSRVPPQRALLDYEAHERTSGGPRPPLIFSTFHPCSSSSWGGEPPSVPAHPSFWSAHSHGQPVAPFSTWTLLIGPPASPPLRCRLVHNTEPREACTQPPTNRRAGLPYMGSLATAQSPARDACPQSPCLGSPSVLGEQLRLFSGSTNCCGFCSDSLACWEGGNTGMGGQ